MNIFLTGATGYIGGSVAARLLAKGHTVVGLVRSSERGALLSDRGIEPVIGTLDDADVLANAASAADLTINAASSDHVGAAQAILTALAGTGKRMLHTSGSSIVGTQAGGESTDDVFDETTPFTPSPGRAARVALNDTIMAAADNGVHPVILCPSLIYGMGHGVRRDSMQVPWLIDLAKRNSGAGHVGPGKNIWSNVHIDDLVDLFELAIEKAPAGGFYFAENGENSMHEVCQSINRSLGFDKAPEALTMAQAAKAWGEGPAKNTMASNSRVRAVRARDELGWQPSAHSLIHEIESGCYRPS